MSDHLLFAVAPYVAAVCLLAGIVARIAALPPTVESPASEHASARRAARRSHVALTVGLLGVCAGHAGMFVAPGGLLEWNRSLSRLIGLEAVLFAFGLTALAGFLGCVVTRPFSSARHPAASPIDAAFCALLLITVATGLFVAVWYRWASAWSAVALAPYVRSLVDFSPDVELVATLPYPVKLHVLSGVVLVGLFPFTRLAGVLSATIHDAIARSAAPVCDAVARGSRQVGERALAGGRNLLWPDED